VAIFMGLAEVLGMVILTARFSVDHDLGSALWMGTFHAVSAFNNAGFDLMGGFSSFQGFANDPLILCTLMGLIVMGSVSYTVVEDLLRRRRFARLTLDSKMVLVTTAALIVLGTVGLLVTEWRNPNTLGQMDPGSRLLNALFQSVSGRTAGFSSVDVGQMSEAGLLLLIGLMTIGGAAGSTAGGLKVETLAIFCFAALSALRGVNHVEAFERRIPLGDVLRSVSVAFLLLSVMFGTALFLNLTERFFFVQDLFEAVSATGTVGLSTGITPETTPVSRVALALTMLVGRLGPLALVLALTTRETLPRYNWPEETVKLG
jgi:trk system potassium uptake protein TrkH